MRYVFAVVLLFSLAGCDVVRDEVGYPGGYPERVANERLFIARSQQQRADRYLMSLTILAPLAAGLAETPATANAAATMIEASYATLDDMHEAIAANCLGGSSNSCSDGSLTNGKNTEFAFESHSYAMQSNLYTLAKMVMNSSNLDDLADDIVELNLLGAVNGLRRAFPTMRQAFATYRDTVVTFADAVAYDTCDTGDCADLKAQVRQFRDGSALETSVVAAENGRSVSALIRSTRKVIKDDNPSWAFGKRHRAGLIYHIDEACKRLAAIQSADLDAPKDCSTSTTSQKKSIISGHAASG